MCEKDQVIIENKELCAKCKGQCCFRCPGNSFPDDWGLPGPDGEAKLKAALLSGKWNVDWYEGNPNTETDNMLKEATLENLQDIINDYKKKFYFVRPAYKGIKQSKNMFHPGWGGPCVFLTKNGCELSYHERPTECRMLIPVEDARCVGESKYKKKAAAIAWEPYNDFFEKLKNSVDSNKVELSNE